MISSALRPSEGALLYVNLGIGALTALANGAALGLTLSGHASALEGKETEIAIWLSLGLTLVGASIVGMFRYSDKAMTLRLQSIAITLLAVMLSMLALKLVFGKLPEIRTIWNFGYLSAVAGYATYLISRFFNQSYFRKYVLAAKWMFLPCCVLADALGFLKIGGFLGLE